MVSEENDSGKRWRVSVPREHLGLEIGTPEQAEALVSLVFC